MLKTQSIANSLALVLALFFLAACGGEDGSNETGPGPADDGNDLGGSDVQPDNADVTANDDVDGGENTQPDVGADTAAPIDVDSGLDVDSGSDVDSGLDGTTEDADLDGAGDALDAGDPSDVADVSPDAGAELGTPCVTDGECASGECVDVAGGGVAGLCSDVCVGADECAEGFDCALVTLEGAAAEGRCLPVDYCADGDGDEFGVGSGCRGVDCNDDDFTVNTDAIDVCDGVDNDCDGIADDNIAGLGEGCSTGSEGVCAPGRTQCVGGEVRCIAFASPVAEVCDGLDNDCDGSADEGVLPEGYRVVGGVCEPVTCGSVPAAPANGRLVSVNSTQFGGEVEYACDAGYVLSAGSLSRICDAAGEWTGSAAVCTPVDCGGLPNPANGSVELFDGTLRGAVAEYSCALGYVLSGNETRSCSDTGLWSGVAPSCAPVDCGEPPVIENGERTYMDTTLGNSASYDCTEGYTLTGSASSTCMVTGTWTAAPSCVVVSCGTLSSPANGSVSTPTGVEYADVATYGCAEGYQIDGAAARTCLASGLWSGTAPTCVDTNECATAGSVCTRAGNACTNTTGSWQCSCAAGYTGTTVTGGDASCLGILDTACSSASQCASVQCSGGLCSNLGRACSADSQCSSREWCPTNTSQRFCSPRPTLPRGTTMAFQYVPSGTFTMGSPGGELGRSTNENQVSVTLTGNYFVSRTEVTQGQWKAATGGSNPSYFQNTTCTSGNCVSTENANNSGPVERLDWYSAVAYANWVSLNQGLSACYTLSGCTDATSGWHDGAHSGCTGATFVGYGCTGYRLLTEAEWERAARAGTTTATYRGDLSGVVTDCTTAQANLDPIAWWCRISGNRSQAVGTRDPNGWGIYDMLGNVSEWTWDWYGATLPGGTNPVGPSTGSNRVLRGGGWFSYALFARAAYRNFDSPAFRYYIFGFRLARSLP